MDIGKVSSRVRIADYTTHPFPANNSPEAEAAWHVFRQTDWLQRQPAVRFVMNQIEGGQEDPKAIALALMERFASPEDATLFKMFWEGR